MIYSKKRNLILATIIFLVGVLAGGKILVTKVFYGNFEHSGTYLVSYVIDGDTFKIGNNIPIRLLGIDSPEKGECYYNESKQALKDLIENKQVRLEKDITDKDKYERWLRYVILPNESKDNLLVNDYLVRQGYAVAMAIPPNNRYRDLLSSAQYEAKKKKRGLWVECDYKVGDSLREQDSAPTNLKCIIKGNISEKGYGRTYLIPGCDNYNTVKIDTRKGEQYFCTEDEAVKAGFRKAVNCP